MPDTDRSPLIEEYGCCRCQRERKPCWHRKGIDAEFEAHLMHQSKHGIRRRPARPAEWFALLMTE